MFARLRRVYRSHVAGLNTPAAFLARWLALLLLLWFAEWFYFAADAGAFLAAVLSFLFTPVFFCAIVAAVFWQRDLRFWDIRVYMRKERRARLDIEKIRQRHLGAGGALAATVVLLIALSVIFYAVGLMAAAFLPSG